MSDTINIGGITVSKFYLGGSSDVKIYLGTTKLYPNVDYSNCFKFVATNSGTFTFNGNDIDYSLDSGATWTTLSNGNATPTITAGSSILWKAGGLTPTSGSGIGTFSSTANFTAAGNVMSLLYGDNFENQTSLSGKDYALRNLFAGCTTLTNIDNMSLPARTLSTSCYRGMFSGCTSLTSVVNLVLSATTLAENCYNRMFYSCTSLTTAPELPATTLAENCYDSMFYGCTSLTTAPELSATTLVRRCYYNMFNRCTSLTTAPELPATTLAIGCYYSMFYQNTSLTTSPVLSAETLVQDCYRQMFYNCRSLNKIICLATDISASNCTNNWVSNVAASGTFYKASGMSSWTTGNSGIPTSWTLVDYSPYKLVAQYSDTTEYKVECDGNTTLSTTDTRGHITPISAMTSAVVNGGGCVTQIGLNAFSGATSLTSLTLSDGITTFNNQAFIEMHSLESFTFPSTLTTFGGSVFRFSNIKKFNNKIPSGVTYLSSGALADMYKLTGMTIPATITGSSTNLFLRDSGLTQVHFEGTTPPALGADAFKGCTALIKIYIPDCDCYDSYAAQSQFSGLTNLIYGEDETKCRQSYNYKLYRKLKNGVTNTTACNSTSALTSGDVRSNYTMSVLSSSTSGLSEVIVGDCVESISAKTFTGMTQLTSITFSDSVKTIGATACCVSDSASSNKLHDINLGKVKTIGNYAFRYCGGNYATNQPKIKFPNTLTTIGTRAFSNGKYNELTFENGGSCSIGNSAFTQSTSYSTITISTNSISQLGAFSFNNFSGLTSVSLSGVTVLDSGGRQFGGCKDLTDLEIRGADLIVPAYFVQGGSLTAITLGGISEISNAYGLNTGNSQASVRTLTMLDTTPPTIGVTSISAYNPTVIYVPASAVNTYKSASGWSTYASRIQAIPT